MASPICGFFCLDGPGHPIGYSGRNEGTPHTMPTRSKPTEKKPAAKAPAKTPKAAGAKPAVAKPAAAKPAKATKPAKPAKPAAPKPAPVLSEAEIARRAYFIAEDRYRTGRPGNAEQDWIEAEQQLRVEAASAKGPRRKSGDA